jgi:hypothetical protein
MGHGDTNRNVLAVKALRDKRNLLRGHTQSTSRSRVEAKPQLVESLIASIDTVTQTNQYRLRRKLRIPVSRLHQMELSSALHPGGQRSNSLFNPMLSASHQLCRGRRSRGPKISNKIRNREVSLMPNRRNDGKLRCSNNAGEHFIIESGEIFHRPAPSCENDHVSQ